MAQHIAKASDELAREMSCFAGGEAAGSGRRLNRQRCQKGNDERDRIEQQRPGSAYTKDQRSRYRRTQNHGQPLNRLARLHRLIFFLWWHDILDERLLRRQEEL